MKIFKIIILILIIIMSMYHYAENIYLKYFLFPSIFGINKNEATSIGIIGSSDGPTAVYVSNTKNILGLILHTALLPIFVIIYIILYIKTKTKNKKENTDI